MKKLLIVVLFAGFVLSTGCMSTVATVRKINDNISKDVIKSSANYDSDTDSNDVAVGINVQQAIPFFKAYWKAWKTEPSDMTKSHLIDGVVIGGTVYGAKFILDEIADDKGSSKSTKVSVSGNNNSVAVHVGDTSTYTEATPIITPVIVTD